MHWVQAHVELIMRSSLPIDETIVRGIYYTMYGLGVAFKFYLLVFKLYMSSASIQKKVHTMFMVNWPDIWKQRRLSAAISALSYTKCTKYVPTSFLSSGSGADTSVIVVLRGDIILI